MDQKTYLLQTKLPESPTPEDHIIDKESPFNQSDVFELYEIQDLDPSATNLDNVLVKISAERKGEEVVKKHGKVFNLIKKLALFQICGFKGTLIHVSALYLAILGLLSALVGVAMDISIEQLFRLKHYISFVYDNIFYSIFIWIAFTLLFVTLAFFWTRIVSPAAAGSGVSEMKVTLLGNKLPNLLTFRTMVAKVVGLVLVIGCGIWAGKEGPFIHIASCIAVQLTRIPIFHFLRESNELFMQILSTACGCGVSSNFGTTIGGLLFSVEVTATYYPVRNYWFGTFSSVIAAFTFRAIYNTYINRPSLYMGLLSIDYTFNPLLFKDSLLSILTGIVCGCFAVLFVFTVSAVFHTRQFLRKYKFGRPPYFYLLLVALLTATVTAPWNGKRSPLSLSTNNTLNILFSNESLESEFGYHYMLTLFFTFIARFCLIAMSVSIPVPAGLFSTNILIGSILGRLIGEWMVYFGVSNELGPSGLAIIGGACFVGATTQTFSSAVILMELTDNIQLIIPMLIATVVTISLSRLLTVSVYDRISMDKKLPHIPDIQYSSHQTADNVMETNLIAVPEFTNIVELKEIVDAYKTVTEKLLPVVNNTENSILLGQIELSVLRKISDSDMPESVASKFLLDYQESPLHLLRSTPLSEIHMLFIAAQIDSAFVTSNGRLIGEVNKKNLSDAIQKQMKILF
ncbi:chloride channel type clc, putative [Entamoeba invadens IP1]|uniref:Chloride channel type clc, putative n=1 Tax=Entamoeba invadens IP1 TaxID=370355 RepID=A0A0A1U1Q0_ENTIV|nr:chloride channel type clc, putative [Entamoeba invadens IP1]ELP84958.1 chloride channel type clc, putative [Entamoeba invadens IP1]|eukprot:XP_004184304.1 chloride channel type clc, putative [Entamoeba invadens IP1]